MPQNRYWVHAIQNKAVQQKHRVERFTYFYILRSKKRSAALVLLFITLKCKLSRWIQSYDTTSAIAQVCRAANHLDSLWIIKPKHITPVWHIKQICASLYRQIYMYTYLDIIVVRYNFRMTMYFFIYYAHLIWSFKGYRVQLSDVSRK